MIERYFLPVVMIVLISGCAASTTPQAAWISTMSQTADLDSALAQCQQEATPKMITVRTEFILQDNAKRRECEQAIRQSPEAKTTYVDDGFGGLKSLDDDAIVEMCEPSVGERRRRDAELAEKQHEVMVPCMQRFGYDLVPSG